jgi:hypothetical protein
MRTTDANPQRHFVAQTVPNGQKMAHQVKCPHREKYPPGERDGGGFAPMQSPTIYLHTLKEPNVFLLTGGNEVPTESDIQILRLKCFVN